MMGEIWRRLVFLLRRGRFNHDLDEEMRFHLEMKAQAAGHYAARRQFGNPTLLKEVAREMWALTARELQRVHEHSLVLIKSAGERVAGFLLEMAERVPTGGAVELTMSRQDIADYLGLTIETVSRTLTQLENTAAIEVPTSRRIVLRNRSALNRLNA